MTTPPPNREAALAEIKTPEAHEMLEALWRIDDDKTLTDAQKDILISQACAKLTQTDPDDELL